MRTHRTGLGGMSGSALGVEKHCCTYGEDGLAETIDFMVNWSCRVEVY